MNSCILVNPLQLWAGLKEGVLYAGAVWLFLGGLIGLLGWKRPTRMAWLHNKLMFGLVLLGGGPITFWVVLSSLLDGIQVQESCLGKGW